MFILTSKYFNDKTRAFDTKMELDTFINRRAIRISNASNIALEDVLDAMVVTENNDINIGSKTSYPSNELSNFAPHSFEIDGITCQSMEGFLQALKFADTSTQKHICSLVGFKAKQAGSLSDWKSKQTLYWQGKPYARNSVAYQRLVARAYNELFKNDSFKQALNATHSAVLKHSMGTHEKNQTVLTTKEFIGNLNRLRERLEN